jgi:hypothetical protein
MSTNPGSTFDATEDASDGPPEPVPPALGAGEL